MDSLRGCPVSYEALKASLLLKQDMKATEVSWH
jgi:hypothetical protein